MQIIVFDLCAEKYGIETSNVQSIDKMMDITNVPCAPDYIRGIINLRGNVITVFDPVKILNISEKNIKRENIIIVDGENEQIGMIVDKVIEVIEIDENMIKNVFINKDDDKQYIKGTINMGKYIFTLIDSEVFLKFILK